MKRQGIAHVVRQFVALAMVLAASVVVLSSTANAVIVKSPVATDSTQTNDLGTTESAGDQNLYHVLKNENSSQVFDVDSFVYLNSNAAGRYIAISDKNLSPADRCQTSGPQTLAGGVSGQPSGNWYVAVTISMVGVPATAATSVTYRIPRDRVCGATYYTPNTANAYGSATSNFFARYPLPTQFYNASTTPDPDTNLYKLQVKIDLNRNTPEGDTSGANRQQAMFKLSTDNACATTNCFFSSVPAAAAARNTSTLGSMTGAEYKRIKMYFGLPCSVNTTRSVALRIYDVDNQSGGTSWDSATPTARRWAQFFVEQRNMTTGAWSALPAASYTAVSGAYPTSSSVITYYDPTSGANRTMIRPDDAGYSNTLVQFTMQPKTQYRVTLGPIWSGNLVGFGLPQENIFGKIDCNVNVTGRVETTPSAGPVLAGQDVTFSPYISRTGTSLFQSNVNHRLFVWYDTAGNSTYDPAAGDERVMTPTNCQLYAPSRVLIGTTEVPLPTCPVTIDTSRASGNAVSVCALLVIGSNDALSQITPPTPVCLSIGKRPHLAAENGDVYAGGALPVTGTCTNTQTPIISGNRVQIGGVNYGSYATYGVTSLGISQAFASNNLRAGDPTSAALVFSNRLENSVHGYFYSNNGSTVIPPNPRCLSDPFTILGARAVTSGGAVSSVDLSALATPGTTVARYYTTGGTLNVTATADIPADTKIIIYARSADVKIDSNIRYANGPYGSVNNIPQVVILTDRNIIIDRSVTQIDGVLGARSDIRTCDTNPLLNVCEQPLTINGAIIAGGIFRPYRTGGAELPDYGAVAETVNLRPDILLSQVPGPGSSNVYMTTVREKEVPPRF